MISVCLPTRGFIFTEVEEALEENLEPFEYRIHRTVGLAIPDAQNTLVEKALKDESAHILFLEEDTVMPHGSLKQMLEVNSDIVCIDYAVNGISCTARDKQTNALLWCGFGCTLIRREAFEVLEKPYFRTDRALRINDWPQKQNDWIMVQPNKSYGGQDIWFCMQARSKGLCIKQIPGECRHLELKSNAKKGINNGIHVISERPRIKTQQYI